MTAFCTERMADFRTHLIGRAPVSAVASLGCYSQGLSDAAETQALFMVGTAASQPTAGHRRGRLRQGVADRGHESGQPDLVLP